jgi:acyl-CoA reductase-like NAD-dependent aldehyde dehydrogenase
VRSHSNLPICLLLTLVFLSSVSSTLARPHRAPVRKRLLIAYFIATGEVLSKVPVGSAADVDIAVKAARTAFKTTWGFNCPGSTRRDLLNKLANLIEQHQDELAALEALNNGKHLR